MAWPNPFQKHDINTRNAWDYTFQWTSDHETPEQYNHLKYSYDTLADECLEVLNQISPPGNKPWKPSKIGAEPMRSRDDSFASSSSSSSPSSLNEKKQKTEEKTNPCQRDLFILLRDNRSTHPKLQELWDQVTTIPSWVDWAQIARGQEVFYRYGGASLTGLAFQSLLGGMGANRVVEVLSRTGGFKIDIARHRLFETTQHVLECTRSLESIQPITGAGFASSIRVRLLHAAVRQRILNLTKSHPSYYSVSQYGIPINDLDSIATITSFCTTPVFMSLPRQGLYLRQSEIEDYIALWRLIAHYTGTPTEYFSSPTKAKAIWESLTLYEINPSPTSQILANNIISALENTPPAYASRGFLEVSARWLNGNRLCDALGLGRPSWYYWILMAGQCLFFCCLCYTYRSFEFLDKRKIRGLRRLFWDVIIEHKEIGLGGTTVFEFKHLPELDKITGMEKTDRERSEVEKWRKGVEGRNLKTLIIAVIAVGSVSWVGLRVGSWAWMNILH